MSDRNKLIVPGVEKMVGQYKEEIAEEFGTHFSPASRDVITRKLADDEKEEKGDGNKNSRRGKKQE